MIVYKQNNISEEILFGDDKTKLNNNSIIMYTFKLKKTFLIISTI